MILLKQIQLNNFLSHQNTVMDFHPNQKLLIDGKSGSGKSAIVEGLVWCFYGRSRVENNKSLVKHGTKTGIVTVTLEDGEDTYVIERKVTSSGKHSIAMLKNNAPVKTAGIKGSQEYIENEILKSSYLLFINSIAYPQDNVENFVKQPADKRKDIILEIINASAYDDYYEKCRVAITDRQSKIVGEEGKVIVLNSDIKRQEEIVESNSKAPILLKTAEEKVEKISVEIEALESAWSAIDKIKEALAIQKSKKSTNDALLAKNISEKGSIQKKIDEIGSYDIEKLKATVGQFEALEAELTELEKISEKATKWDEDYIALIKTKPTTQDYDADIAFMNKKIMELMKEELEMCPELDKVCPIVKKKQDQIIKQEEETLNDVIRRKEIKDEAMKTFESALNTLGVRPVPDTGKIALLKKQLGEIQTAKVEYAVAQQGAATIADLEKRIIELDAESKTIEESNKTLEQEIVVLEDKVTKGWGLKKTLDESYLEYRGLENDVTILKNGIALAETATKRIAEINKELSEIETETKSIKSEIEGLQLLKEALGPKGLKTIVVDYVIPRLEDKINNILGQLSDFTVKLETQKTGSKDSITLEGLFITIVNDMGDEFDYGNYSGGEKLKITVAISEALSEIQKIGFRVLDELFIGLDEDSTESFVQVMETLNQRFSQMICVTHLRDIKETFPEKATVVKRNGTSIVV